VKIGNGFPSPSVYKTPPAEAKEAGTKKAAALAAAITQAEGIAKDRGGLTDELKAALAKRADEVFGAGKK
jgi:hypothetical protein